MNTDNPSYLLAEANQDLISLFSFLKTEQNEFIAYCRQFFSKENNQEFRYYELRAQFNASQNARERAAMFLYLNRHGYNGLCS